MRAYCAPRLAAVTALFIALFPAGAFACSCMFSSTPDAFVSEVSIIINGTLEKTEPCANGDEACVVGTFRVNEIFKGPAVTTVRISYYGGDGSSCGYGFPLRKSRMIAAYGDVDSGFQTGSCTQYPLDHGGAGNPHILAAMRYRDNISVFDRALLTSPDDAALLLRKAAFLTRHRDVDRGLEAVDRLLAQTPNQRDALLLKAELLTAKGRDDEARKIVGGVLPSPGSAVDEATRQWVRMLVRQGRRDEIPEDWRDFEGIELDGGRLFLRGGMEGANFRGARLNGVYLDNNLRGADFTGAVLTDVRLEYADLSQAILRNTQLGNGMWREINLSGANLEGARGSPRLFESNLQGLWAPFADLPKAAFIGGTARGAVFASSNLEAAVFDGGLDLSGVDFTDAKLLGAHLAHANLTGAILRGADIRKASLKYANLENADLSDAVYDQATEWPDGFDPVAAGARKTAD